MHNPVSYRALLGSLLLGASLAMPALAEADLYVAVGKNNESQTSLKLELDREYSLAQWQPGLSLRLAGGVLLLPGDEGDDNAALIVTPAFRYTFADTATQPFVEAGVGGALFMDTHYEGRNLSTAFQFEDRIAAGLHVGRGEMALAFTHYSNADIKKPNNGLDMVTLGYRHPL
ncbi:lipid A 3-O-deacylase [Modicisalibacter xianhensis]|uniref:Lipid A 3-O-deacylase n=1 Tax=Modicisalibacter xianhensis TaxID=442341 RepID=A0A4V3GSL7_9GAMM|nr:acyloxyacyl hydrolase [Halomonas xianhensis]TDX23323.1 lipid A 3-O-deacylase [Halomonas xianhensis]